MEQRKSDINTDDNVLNVNANGLNYSFDFSGQVDTVPSVNEGVTPSVESLNVETLDATPAATPEPATVEPAPTVAPEPATVEPAPAVAPEPATVEPAPTVAPEPATVEPAPTVAPEPAAVEPAPMNTESVVTPEGTEQVLSENKVVAQEESEESLIKDEKATKKFLIIIVVIVIAFIIALPFIYNLINH